MRYKNEKRAVQMIRLKDIIPGKYQPRRIHDEESILRLAESIKRYGVLQPICVSPVSDKLPTKYELITGDARLSAARYVSLETIPAVVVFNPSPSLACEIRILESSQSESGFFEEAEAISSLIRIFGLTVAEAADRLAMKKPEVLSKLRLLSFDWQERTLITNNHLTEDQARAILMLDAPSKRLFALRYITEKHLSDERIDLFVAAYMQHPEEFSLYQRRVPDFSLPEDSSEVYNGHCSREKVSIPDVRFFVNSIDHAVKRIQNSGIEINSSKNVNDEYVEYNIQVPKYREER